jgi:hypothetical protein
MDKKLSLKLNGEKKKEITWWQICPRNIAGFDPL